MSISTVGARVEEVEALEAAIRIAASMLPNHPTPALHRFRDAEMVKDDAGIEKQGHQEDNKQLIKPA